MRLRWWRRDDVGDRAQLIVKIADVKQHSVRRFESQALLRAAVASSPAPDRTTAVALQVALAHDHFWRGEFSEMSRVARAVSADGTSRTTPMVILAQVLDSLADFYLARVDDAQAKLADAEATLAALPDDLFGQNLMLSTQIALAACRLERFDDARAHVQRGLRVSQETGQSFIIPTLLRVESNALVMMGRLEEALRAAEAGAESASASGHDRLAMWALEAVSMAAYWLGDVERALASAREAVACAERTAEPFFIAMSQILLAGAQLADGDAASARKQLAAVDADGPRRLLDLGAAHGWALLTEAHLALGDLDAAEDVSARAQTRAEAPPLLQQAAGARCARAKVMLARGEARAASAAAHDAVDGFDRAGNPMLCARARAISGTALGAAGERERGVAELRHAEEVLSACGARREADAAVRELRRMGERVFRRA